jgi:KDO2-lipid IV(A) lauroyltransferase
MLALLGFRIADSIVHRLPLATSRGLARGLARLAFALRVPARRRLEANLRRLGGPDRAEAASRAREAFEHFAISVVDFLRLSRLGPEGVAREVEVLGSEHLDAARRSGRGVILLSAHVGNWEWGAAFLSAIGKPVRVAAREQRGRALEAFFARRREQHGVSRLAGQPLWLAAARALRRREWVALMGDRDGGRGAVSVCAWSAALARRTGALILPAVMLHRPGGGYQACFEAPISPRECAGGGYREVVRLLLDRHPGQWLGFEPIPEGLA